VPKKRSKDSSKGQSPNTEKSSLSTSDLPIFKRLTSNSRESFEKLCDLGCDPGILSDYLDLLPWRQLPPRTISPREAKQIAGRAEKVLVDIECLEKLHLMDVMPPFPVNDDIPHNEVFCAARVLQEMVELPKFIKEVWPQWNPTYKSLLSAIYNYVHTETKHWKDALLADILNDLFPHPEDPIFNEESLKRWRQFHGLKDKRKAK